MAWQSYSVRVSNRCQKETKNERSWTSSILIYTIFTNTQHTRISDTYVCCFSSIVQNRNKSAERNWGWKLENLCYVIWILFYFCADYVGANVHNIVLRSHMNPSKIAWYVIEIFWTRIAWCKWQRERNDKMQHTQNKEPMSNKNKNEAKHLMVQWSNANGKSLIERWGERDNNEIHEKNRNAFTRNENESEKICS